MLMKKKRHLRVRHKFIRKLIITHCIIYLDFVKSEKKNIAYLYIKWLMHQQVLKTHKLVATMNIHLPINSDLIE